MRLMLQKRLPGNNVVDKAKPANNEEFTDYKQKEFINFVLERYVEDGVYELSISKMKSLIEIKYNTINDAAAEFGSPKIIRGMFVGFQGHLYQV